MFPRIGMRIIKSAVGVFLCYLVNMLRGDAGIVFYSQLAVLWCMQDYVSETKSKAKQRTVGTFIGALWGLIVILVYQYICQIFGTPSQLVYGFLVSVSIVLVIYTTVVLNKKQASYFSCVVLLSIVVNHIADANPYLFAFNRVLDTMIGIAIGVVVNCFQLPRTKNRNTLFLSGLDDTLLAPNGQMSDYSRVELNRLIEDGAKFSISTIRTPASLMTPLKDVKLKLPVIVMDGAALFNIAEKKYEYAYVISPENSSIIKNYLAQNEIPYFANVIIDDLLIIYYQQTNHEGYNELVKKLRTSPYRNYIKRRVPDDESIVYFMVIDQKDRIAELYPTTLSGGQQQRIAIARALCSQTNIILFDEPTSALDPETIQEVLDVMIKLAKENITMVVVTHEMGFAKQVADRIVFMADGQIIEEGDPEHFFNNPESERVKQFLGKIIRK